jgi:NTP pyrophosphatase (non-canonical NTP hydrolase)
MYNFDVMDINDLTKAMHEFVREKGWYAPDSPRPQTAKNLAASLSIEAAEVLELFQWVEKPPDPDSLASEIADVALYLLQLASVSGIDLEEAVLEKLRYNYKRNWNKHPDLEKEDL